MPVVMMAVLSIGAYFSVALLQWPSIKQRWCWPQKRVLMVSTLAVIAHAGLLYQYYWASYHPPSFMLSLSLSSWLVACLLVVASLFRPILSLSLVVFPITIVSLCVGLLFPLVGIHDALLSPVLAFHVFLSLLTFAVFCVAGLQALFIIAQQYCLRHAKSSAFMLSLPPLQTMEACLFEMLYLGFVLLTILLATAAIFFNHQLFLSASVWPKTLIACVAWIIFACLLMGRLIRGWRGRWMMLGIIGGFFLIWLVYFGSQLLGSVV